MTCKTIVSMAKDLDLHEHLETHNEGESCGSDPVECLTKTRVWQTILVCETMIGAPQGVCSSYERRSITDGTYRSLRHGCGPGIC